jgi:hypothetical protein
MKWLPSGLAVCLLFVIAAPGLAQKPAATGDVRMRDTISVGEVAPTPEMWFYQQYAREYKDPKTAVRLKAEERSAQRRGRLAAMQWFGFSNARPRAGTDPIHGDYSPAWTSGNANYPYRWTGYGAAVVVVRPWVSTRVY